MALFWLHLRFHWTDFAHLQTWKLRREDTSTFGSTYYLYGNDGQTWRSAEGSGAPIENFSFVLLMFNRDTSKAFQSYKAFFQSQFVKRNYVPNITNFMYDTNCSQLLKMYMVNGNFVVVAIAEMSFK